MSELVPELPKHIHMVGIGGIGLSAIAQILLKRGHIVTGSDQAESALNAHLRSLGITVYIGHKPDNLGQAELVVISSAIPDTNVEVMAAQARGIPVIKRRTLLAKLLAGYEGIAVGGTHGKTTTAAMLAVTLSRLGADPSFIVGGIIPEFDSNAGAGTGRLFILEADEYDGAFQDLCPQIGIITNIEMDHPDCYPNLDAVCAAFDGFMRHVLPGGMLVLCADNDNVMRLAARGGYAAEVRTYGCSAGADYRVVDATPQPDGGIRWKILYRDELWLAPQLTLNGVHNALNATAVLMTIERLGMDVNRACDILAEFRGVRRRFELKGQVGGIVVIDDYAHHPTQIRATLAAARARYPQRRIWAVFQPHTYSRTRALWESFLECFRDADQVIIMDVYRARERERDEIRSSDLAKAIKHPHVRWLGTRDQVVQTLIRELAPGDVLLTLGAGDGYLVGEEILNEMQVRG